ncbi:hypothetical protein TURU_091932 [Turdus rufiventris]|nr:hypothetical protein TURU_091932 [Turdus rufiventris]
MDFKPFLLRTGPAQYQIQFGALQQICEGLQVLRKVVQRTGGTGKTVVASAAPLLQPPEQHSLQAAEDNKRARD